MLKLKNVNIVEPRTSKNLLNNVTVEVREGDYIVITGSNEREQEALLSVLGAVEPVKSGEVYVEGIELSKHTPSQLLILKRGKFGYLLKDSELDSSLSVGENVCLPLVFAGESAKEQEDKVERALGIVGLTAFKDLKLTALTEWQRNKVLIARAIVNEPKVLVLSEPCRVQDKTKLQEVLSLLSALNRDGVTIVVASNNVEYVQKSKRRIDISSGSITEIKKERAPREKEAKKPRAKKMFKPAEKKPRKEKEETLIAETKSEATAEAIESEQLPKVAKKKTAKKAESGEEVSEETQKKSVKKKKKEVEDHADIIG